MTKLFFALVLFGSSAFVRAQADAPALPRPTVDPVSAQAERTGAAADLMAEMLVSIDAGKAKVGDVITAKVRSDALSASQTLLPYGATLIGYVRDVRRGTKEQPGSMLSVCFNKARLKDGAEVPVNLMPYQLAALEQPAAPEQAPVSRPIDDNLSPPNLSQDRMAPRKGPYPNRHVAMGQPERNSGAYSPAVHTSTREQLDFTPEMPPAASGLDGVRLATVRQHTASFAVLTSDARNVQVNKHDLVFFRIVQEPNPETTLPKK